MEEINKIVGDLDKLTKGIDKVKKPDTTIVKDNQFVDTSNVRSKKVLSDTKEDAIHEARYQLLLKGELDSNLDLNLDIEDTEQVDSEIINRFVRDFLDKLFFF